MCCVRQKHSFIASLFSQWDFRSIPLLCQQGLPVSGSQALAEKHAATSSDKMTFCHSLSGRLHPFSLLVPSWNGWMQEMEVQKEKCETFMYYVRNTQHSVQNQVMQNHFSSASHSFGSICAGFLGFFRSIQSLPPSLSSPLGSHRPCKGLRRGEMENKREGGRQTER